MDLKGTEIRPATVNERAESAGATMISMGMASILGVVPAFAISMESGRSGPTVWLLVLVPLVLLALIMARCRATVGMVMTGLWIGTPAREEVSFVLCFARVLLAMLLGPIYPISIIIACFNRQHRTIADLVCGTAVWTGRGTAGRAQPTGFRVIMKADAAESQGKELRE